MSAWHAGTMMLCSRSVTGWWPKTTTDTTGYSPKGKTAAAVTLAGGVLPPIVGLAHPVRDGLSFATRPEPCPARIALVHGIAPGGGHVALVLGRLGPEPRLLRVA